ncbi:hypothetical protein QYE76_019516 [Lolium multiflorum]|uniref:Uncharacterized protein n=1 Tax=Lolium multiflorum TaxID=4521 RepID=A0AAD8VP63_LOLMU|nr:hypothetical protein QYE76_019516 [Lolium multiflorum]
MLRLRSSILARLLSSPASSPISQLHRQLSAAAPPITPNHHSFALDDYLVHNCGLTRPQALKVSGKLAHITSPTKPDAVLAFLAGLGLSRADVAAVVAKDPKILCAGVEKTLTPTVIDLAGLGLSRTEIARLVSLTPGNFRRRSLVSNLPYYISLFGSTDNLVPFFKQSSGLLGSSLDKVVRPNVAFLQQCGLRDCDISKLCLSTPWVLSANPEQVRAFVACAEGLGVPRGSRTYMNALDAIAFLGEDNVAAKVEYLKKTLRWSDAELRMAVCKAPNVLKRSKESLQRRSHFFFSEVGLEPAYIARRPVMLCYNLESRLRPRYYVFKFLMVNGLLDNGWGFNSISKVSEKVFMDKFICPHKESAPHLAQDYAKACRGEVPVSFRFT